MSKRSEEVSPCLPLKFRLMMAALSAAVRISCRSNFTINRNLMKLTEMKVPASSQPINGVSSFDFPIDSTPNLWFRLYIPATTTISSNSTLPLVIYFHGGGFCFFSADSKHFDQFCRRIALDTPAAVVSVNYRLAPEHKYPSQYDDGFETLKFIDGMSFDFDDFSAAKLDLRRCFVAGDSAGGNLAHHVAVKAINFNFTNLNVIGVVAIQPFFGGEERTESETLFDRAPGLSVEHSDWYWKAFLPVGADRNHEAVNVFGANAVDMTAMDFPATLICIGGCDILKDWQKRYYEGLKKSGKDVHLVEYPKMIHGFYIFSELNESSLLIHEIKIFIEKTSGKLSI